MLLKSDFKDAFSGQNRILHVGEARALDVALVSIVSPALIISLAVPCLYVVLTHSRYGL